MGKKKKKSLNNKWITLVLGAGLISLVVYGFFFYKGTSKPVEEKLETEIISATAEPSATPVPKTLTFTNKEVGISFQYPSTLTLDPRSPKIHNADQWTVSLLFQNGDELAIRNLLPPDWPDCREVIDRQTIKGFIDFEHAKEINDMKNCPGGDNRIAWYATAKQNNRSWIVSTSTREFSKIIQREEAYFQILKTFKPLN